MDPWVTALLVLGEKDGVTLAREKGIDALFVLREGSRLREVLVLGSYCVTQTIPALEAADGTGSNFTRDDDPGDHLHCGVTISTELAASAPSIALWIKDVAHLLRPPTDIPGDGKRFIRPRL